MSKIYLCLIYKFWIPWVRCPEKGPPMIRRLILLAGILLIGAGAAAATSMLWHGGPSSPMTLDSFPMTLGCPQ